MTTTERERDRHTAAEASHHGRRAGQAMIEFVVALLAILILFGAILQISSMGLIRNQMMARARNEAGMLAMQDAPSFFIPDYILDRTLGPDQVSYSSDDDIVPGNPAGFINRVVNYSDPNELDRYVPDNEFSVMPGLQAPQQEFGLLNGRARQTVDLLPVIRHLLYASDQVVVEGEAWMTWTKGIY
jgi:hypothetical protein